MIEKVSLLYTSAGAHVSEQLCHETHYQRIFRSDWDRLLLARSFKITERFPLYKWDLRRRQTPYYPILHQVTKTNLMTLMGSKSRTSPLRGIFQRWLLGAEPYHVYGIEDLNSTSKGRITGLRIG